MPRLRRLSGKDVLKILADLGFELYSQSGSHIKVQRIAEDGSKQRIIVPVHGSKQLKMGTLKSIYRSALAFVPEEILKTLFYAD
jgi:predicted RNA binding protein YcfA (HicA-like mRNA interferase family)